MLYRYLPRYANLVPGPHFHDYLSLKKTKKLFQNSSAKKFGFSVLSIEQINLKY